MHLHLIAKILLVAATAFDAGTSFGQRETNPILATNGRFEMRGVAIKAGITTGILLIERHHDSKVIDAINLGAVAGYTVAGVHNLRIANAGH